MFAGICFSTMAEGCHKIQIAKLTWVFIGKKIWRSKKNAIERHWKAITDAKRRRRGREWERARWGSDNPIKSLYRNPLAEVKCISQYLNERMDRNFVNFYYDSRILASIRENANIFVYCFCWGKDNEHWLDLGSNHSMIFKLQFVKGKR